MITSIQNEKVRQWNKLKKKKGRNNTGTFLIEGFHLIEEAHRSEWEICEIILQDGVCAPQFSGNYQVTMVSSNVFSHISNTKTPQGIAAVVNMKIHRWNSSFERVLMVDALQDPGNLGTIIRTADAAGFDAVVLGENSVDMYNDKVIRATQGSLFHLPTFRENLLQKVPALQQEGFTVWAAALENASPYAELKAEKKIALIVGNEGGGISEQVLTLANKIVKIPIYGKADSLNVSVAAGILMYYLAG